MSYPYVQCRRVYPLFYRFSAFLSYVLLYTITNNPCVHIDNNGGIISLLTNPEVKDELNCLLGIGCVVPDVLVVQSAPHDVLPSINNPSEYVKYAHQFFEILNNVKTRTTSSGSNTSPRIYWRSSYANVPFVGKLNNFHKVLAKRYNIPYIPTGEELERLYNLFINVKEMTNLPHIGPIAQSPYEGAVMTWMNQMMLRGICS
jgi:hypothetical protein